MGTVDRCVLSTLFVHYDFMVFTLFLGDRLVVASMSRSKIVGSVTTSIKLNKNQNTLN